MLTQILIREACFLDKPGQPVLGISHRGACSRQACCAWRTCEGLAAGQAVHTQPLPSLLQGCAKMLHPS